LLASAIAACAPLPPHLIDPQVHPRFRPAGYITAVGQGPGRIVAEQRARDGVARQVQSTIRSELRVLEQEHQTDGGSYAESHVWQEISERSRFDHARLIRLDAGGAVEKGGIHYAFAYMDRAKAAQELAETQRALTPQLSASYCRAISAAGDLRPSGVSLPPDCPVSASTDPDPAQAALALTEFRSKYGQWLAIEAQRRAIRGGAGPVAGPRSWATTLANVTSAIRERVTWTISVASVKADDPLAVTVATQVRDAVAQMGLRALVSPGQGACPPDSGPSTELHYGIEVQAHDEVVWSSLGWKAILKLPSVGVRCATGQTLFRLDLAGKGITAINPSHQDKARQAVIAKIDPAKVAAALRASVASVIPLL
jgi:hypothetical protein